MFSRHNLGVAVLKTCGRYHTTASAIKISFYSKRVARTQSSLRSLFWDSKNSSYPISSEPRVQVGFLPARPVSRPHEPRPLCGAPATRRRSLSRVWGDKASGGTSSGSWRRAWVAPLGSGTQVPEPAPGLCLPPSYPNRGPVGRRAVGRSPRGPAGPAAITVLRWSPLRVAGLQAGGRASLAGSCHLASRFPLATSKARLHWLVGR